MVLGADCRPSSHDQFWVWVTSTIPRFQHFHMVGLLAICWALWNARNRVCFKGKMTRSPTEIICSASSFLTYWAGAEALKEAALHFHPTEATAEDTGMVLIQWLLRRTLSVGKSP
ncbi:hypothetical protein SETIT_9G004500v2 [Setaria italica]|uniref:Uncharacterized protein n=1 Tax=Setaria italica TaxID=4555 RepID=A0A368SBP3_SETIT|nr:hypothetical protein SETIT_9G004500v2 [Setaria italica]